MGRVSLIAVLHRLLDVGEPLLTVFPKKFSNGWVLELPDSISEEMRVYADDVAYRKWVCDYGRYKLVGGSVPYLFCGLDGVGGGGGVS